MSITSFAKIYANTHLKECHGGGSSCNGNTETTEQMYKKWADEKARIKKIKAPEGYTVSSIGNINIAGYYSKNKDIRIRARVKKMQHMLNGLGIYKNNLNAKFNCNIFRDNLDYLSNDLLDDADRILSLVKILYEDEVIPYLENLSTHNTFVKGSDLFENKLTMFARVYNKTHLQECDSGVGCGHGNDDYVGPTDEERRLKDLTDSKLNQFKIKSLESKIKTLCRTLGLKQKDFIVR